MAQKFKAFIYPTEPGSPERLANSQHEHLYSVLDVATKRHPAVKHWILLYTDGSYRLCSEVPTRPS